MPPPPPELPADLVEQIFLRLPPDDPGCLFRASLISKSWLRRLSGPTFRRLYCELHRTPPMLGFLGSRQVREEGYFFNTHIFPTVKLSPPGPGRRCLRALDTRHGRVLFQTDPEDQDVRPELIIWDPITHQEWIIPEPEHSFGNWAAVLCAKEGCDHLDCHGPPFLVAFVFQTEEDASCAALLYSSETDSWSDKTYVGQDVDLCLYTLGFGYMPISVLVGNTVYFDCYFVGRIIQYDLADRELSLVDTPSDEGQLTVENGVLGFAKIKESSIYLWSREVDGHGAAAWVQQRVIKLLLPPRSLSTEPIMCGFAQGIGVVFLITEEDGIFTVEIKSGRARNLCNKGNNNDPLVPFLFDKPGVTLPVAKYFIPYMSFYTPGRDIKPLPPGPSVIVGQ